MLQFLRRLFRRERGQVTPFPNMIDVIDEDFRRRAIVLGRVGYHLKIRISDTDCLICREDAVSTDEFDRVLASFPLFTEPMFTEDGEEVDPREFY